MKALDRWFWSWYLALGVLLFSSLFAFYPGLLGPFNVWLHYGEVPPTLYGFSSQNENLTASTAQFREGILRQGFVIDARLGVNLKEDWNANANIGVHLASKSSPVVDASGIYLGTDGGWFIKYNFAGEIQWRFRVINSQFGIHGSAAIDEESVYFGAYNGYLYALDKATGALRWRVRMGEAIGSSPLLWGNELFVSVELLNPNNGHLSRIDKRNGTMKRWSSALGHHAHASPVAVPDANLVVVGANNGKLFAFDRETLALVWEIDTKGAIKGTITNVDNILYFTNWNKEILAVAGDSGKILWRQVLPENSQSSVTYVPQLDLLVVGSGKGNLHAFAKDDGRQVWHQKFPPEARTNMSSAIAVFEKSNSDWVVWSPCTAKTLCAFLAKNGRELSRIALRDEVTGVPAIYEDRLFVAMDGVGGLSSFSSLRE